MDPFCNTHGSRDHMGQKSRIKFTLSQWGMKRMELARVYRTNKACGQRK